MSGFVSRARLCLVVGILAVSVAAAGAQVSPPPAALEGIVKDGTGGVLADAVVAVRAEATAIERVTETLRDGTFRVTGLPPGDYAVSVSSAGFAMARATVTLPSTTPLTLSLEPAPVVEQVRVVSASRQDELRETLNTRVDVLTRARIEDTGAQTVAEVLREIPGVMTRRGSEGAGAAGEQIQGIDSRQVLVLMDGLPLVGARGIKSGIFNLDRQTTNRLERVEVVKGASSALYGSDAIGGVINLITRRARSPLELGASLSGGSRDEMNVTGEVGFIESELSGFGSIERHQQDGFDLTPSTVDTTAPDRRRVDFFGRLGWQPAAALTLSGVLSGYGNRAAGVSIGELGPENDTAHDSTANTGVIADWLVTPLTTVQARGYHARYSETSTGVLLSGGDAEPGALDERLTRADLTLSHVLGSRQHLQGGVEYTRDEYAGLNRLRRDAGEDVWTGVVWGQHRLNAGARVTTTIGARVDRHSIFGTAFSPKAGVNVRLLDGLSARASYGRGFRAPDVGQLYYRFLNPTNFYQVIGNEHLRPEYADSLQVGAEFVGRDRRVRLGANVFRNDVRDLILSDSLGFIATPGQLAAVLAERGIDPSFRPAVGRLLFTYENVQDAVTQGLELDGEVALAPTLTLAGAYTYLDAFDDETDLQLTGRHRHHGTVRLAWTEPRTGFRANLRGTLFSSWVSSRASDGSEVRGEAFSLWDAYVAKGLAAGTELFVAVDNLADNQDPNVGRIDADGSPASILRSEIGRTVRFGLRWNWSAR